jgi:hypothetical protein
VIPTKKAKDWHAKLVPCKKTRKPCASCGKPTVKDKCPKCARNDEPMNPVAAVTVDALLLSGRYRRCPHCASIRNPATSAKCPKCGLSTLTKDVKL